MPACSFTIRLAIDSSTTSVNLRSSDEQTHELANGRWQIGVRACLRSNVLPGFPGNLYSRWQIRHTCYLAHVASTSRLNWTRVERNADLPATPSRNVCSMVSQILLSLEKGK